MFRRRAFRAAALMLVLLSGIADWHPGGKAAHTLFERPGEVYFPGVSHPEQPVHFDSADPAVRPSCPICLHQLQTSGAHLPAAGLLAPPHLDSRLVPAAAPVHGDGSSRATGARGPPAVS